uniref:Uncharacterized protein n=1 Tax=Cacopsylla melanoneura TaxID=428564 RepID=A0A8D8ZX60_9HEMI
MELLIRDKEIEMSNEIEKMARNLTMLTVDNKEIVGNTERVNNMERVNNTEIVNNMEIVKTVEIKIDRMAVKSEKIEAIAMEEIEIEAIDIRETNKIDRTVTNLNQ